MVGTEHRMEIPASEVVGNIVVNLKIKGWRKQYLRLRVGMFVMRLGVWITGMGINIEEHDKD